MAWILTSLLKSISPNSRSTTGSVLVWLGLGLVLANAAPGSASADVPDQPPSASNFLSQDAAPDTLTNSSDTDAALEEFEVSKNLPEDLQACEAGQPAAISQEGTVRIALPTLSPANSGSEPATSIVSCVAPTQTAAQPAAPAALEDIASDIEIASALAAAETAAANTAGTPSPIASSEIAQASVELSAPAASPPAQPSTLISNTGGLAAQEPGAIAGSAAPFTFYPVTPGYPVGGTATVPQFPGFVAPGGPVGSPGAPYATPQPGFVGVLPQGAVPNSSTPFVFYMPAQPGYSTGYSTQVMPGVGGNAGGAVSYPTAVMGYLPNGTPVPVILQMPAGYPGSYPAGYPGTYSTNPVPAPTFNPSAGFAFQPPAPQGQAVTVFPGAMGYGYGVPPQAGVMGVMPGSIPGTVPGSGTFPGYSAYGAPAGVGTVQTGYPGQTGYPAQTGYPTGYGYGAIAPGMPMSPSGLVMQNQSPGWPTPNWQSPSALPNNPTGGVTPLSVPSAPSRTGNPSTPLPPPPYQSQTLPVGGTVPTGTVFAQFAPNVPPTFVPGVQPAPLPPQNPGFPATQPGIQTIPVIPPGTANQLTPVPGAPIYAQPLPPTPGQEALATRSQPLNQPTLQLQAAAIYQGDDFSARGRLTGTYPFSPNFLLGGSLDLTTGDSFSDSDSSGLSLNELYVAGSLPNVPSFRLVAGQMDLTSYFDRNSFAKDSLTHFFNPVFQTNPALAAAAIGSRTGILLNWSITDNLEAKVATFSSDRSIDEFALNAFAGEVGFRVGNLILRGTYTSSIDGGKNDGFRESGSAPRGDGSFGIESGDRESAYGVNAEMFIPELNLGLFGRYGQYYNRDLDESGDTYSFGVNLFDLFTDGDRLGLGYGQALSNAGLRRDAGIRLPSVLEVFYDLPVARNIRMGFTFQQLNEFSESIAGVRLRADFDVTPRGSF